MCAFPVAVDVRPVVHAGRLKSILISGLATAASALGGFGLAHALLITPIWDKLLRGTPFAVVGGVTLAAAYDQIGDTAERSSWLRGAQFGATMLLALLPATALDTALRLTGLRRADAVETAAAMLLAAIGGGVAGWVWTRRRSAVIAFCTASLGLMIATAGPLPVAQSEAGLWLSIAIAAICVSAGIIVAVTQRAIRLGTP